MECYCCGKEIKIARKVKLRKWRDLSPDILIYGPDSPQYMAFKEEMTYRWAVICNACYRILDNYSGRAEIPGHGLFNLAGKSRGDQATTIDEAKYRAFQRKEAKKLGIDLSNGD